MKIVLADNHDLIIDGLTRMIKDANLSSHVFTALNGEDAFNLCMEHQPDMIISDYKMGMMNGLDLLIKVRKHNFKGKFLIISMVDELAIIEVLMDQGVDGFMNKETSADEMLYGIKELKAGRKYFCRMTQNVLKKRKENLKTDNFLSRRELEVLKEIISEKKNLQIARDLHIHVSTVETHKKNMIKKLGVKSSLGLMRYALENNLFK